MNKKVNIKDLKKTAHKIKRYSEEEKQLPCCYKAIQQERAKRIKNIEDIEVEHQKEIKEAYKAGYRDGAIKQTTLKDK